MDESVTGGRVFAFAFTISEGERGNTCFAFRRQQENYSARVISRGVLHLCKYNVFVKWLAKTAVDYVFRGAARTLLCKCSGERSSPPLPAARCCQTSRKFANRRCRGVRPVRPHDNRKFATARCTDPHKFRVRLIKSYSNKFLKDRTVRYCYFAKGMKKLSSNGGARGKWKSIPECQKRFIKITFLFKNKYNFRWRSLLEARKLTKIRYNTYNRMRVLISDPFLIIMFSRAFRVVRENSAGAR